MNYKITHSYSNKYIASDTHAIILFVTLVPSLHFKSSINIDLVISNFIHHFVTRYSKTTIFAS